MIGGMGDGIRDEIRDANEEALERYGEELLYFGAVLRVRGDY